MTLFPNPFKPIPAHRLARILFDLWHLLLLCAVYFHVTAAREFLPLPDPMDARTVYLPLAREFLSQGWSLFSQEETLRVAPGAFLWPALFQGQSEVIRIANLSLSACIPLLLYSLGQRLHSRQAGLLAAVGYALSPMFPPLVSRVLTEPPYLFFTALWWWGLASLSRGGRMYPLLAAIACAFSILIRPLWLYPILALLPVFAWLHWRKRIPWMGTVLGVHVAALIIPLLYIVRNELVFGLAGLSTGSGAALYFGNHPLTGGMEPNHLGLGFDEFAMIGDLGHLSLLGDAGLKAVAMALIQERSFWEQTSWLLHKVGLFLFFSGFDHTHDAAAAGILRSIEIPLALVGAWKLRHHPFVSLLAVATALQLGQLTWVLYNYRYSVGALELPLILLAALGLASALSASELTLRTGRRKIALVIELTQRWPVVAKTWGLTGGVLLMTLAASTWHRNHALIPAPFLGDNPPVTPLFQAQYPVAGELNAVAPTGRPGEYRSTARAFGIGLPIPRLDTRPGDNQIWDIELALTPGEDKSCRQGDVSFFTLRPRVANYWHEARPFRIIADGQVHRYTFGAAYNVGPLYPAGEGFLRLSLAKCGRGTTLRIHRLALHESRMHDRYAPLAQAAIKNRP